MTDAARASSAFAQAPMPRAFSSPAVASGALAEQHHHLPVELPEVSGMRSSELRRLSQAAATQGAHSLLWQAIADRCEDFAEQMRHWDIVYVLQAFTDARVENKQLFHRLADTLCTKTSKFPPKHLLDVFAVYEAIGLRPRALYVELFHAMIRLSRSMYAEELTLMLQCLARYRLGNPTAVAHLVSAIQRQLRDVRLRYLCGITGALGSLQMVPDTMLAEFDGHAQFEVETVGIQELLENLQAFPQLEFSWQPYEDLCLEQFKERIAGFKTAADVGALADPFEAMFFLRAKGLLEPGFLEALTQWCLFTVHRPNVRSERRPTARQLGLLHERCQEHGLETSPALQDAIAYYVESGGGQWPQELPKPLQYNKGRRYIRTVDPIEDFVGQAVVPQFGELGQHSVRLPSRQQQALVQDLPGLPSSNDLFVEPATEWHEDDAVVEVETSLVHHPKRSVKKCGGEQVGAFITSRKSVRPRHRRDPGLKRLLRKNWHRLPLFMLPGYASRPKYRPGVATRRYPWADIPVGANGASWVLRR